ncbi:RNA polymerase sigma factor [Granulicella aggregans]|jgi:RNA polymerase sigma-70 factor (ECF subfamily)|uniref:RNA polymerase sigma factor n=1 Tax=Granulicella aggregans TaxID=474949 RepID=UPI0021E0B9B3|nr:sigma-70 family RNA polymerase sigma factor [Granulicella aggregans]
MNWRFVRADTSSLLGSPEACLEAADLPLLSPETSLIGLVRQRFASDEELAEQLQSGDADALAILFKRHAPLLFGIARRILRNDAEAEDVVQQIFLDVFRSIRQFDSEKGRFKSWLLMFAYQRTFNSRRSQISNKFFVTDPFDDPLVEAGQPGAPEFGRLPIENSILVEQVLSRLQPRQRRTIELIYREGLTAEEVSARTGESVRVVRHNLYRGLEKLRKSFSEQRQTITKAGSI